MRKPLIIEKLNPQKKQSDIFHEYSKNKSLINEDISYPNDWINIHFKTYPRLNAKKLKIRGRTPAFVKVLSKRRSARNFRGEKLSFDVISKLLTYSAGLKKITSNINESKRNYPSAGARYPLEIYLAAINMQGLDKGLYHYNVKDNSLELLLHKDLSEWVYNISGGEKWLKKSGVVLFITAVLDRTQTKYSERGYRYALIETGHMVQNILLVGSELNVKCCPMGGFIDDEVKKMLDLGIAREVPLYMVACGK